jgi:hypothetical protein
VAFEFFSSFTMTMNVMLVRPPSVTAPEADTEANAIWHGVLEETGMCVQ